MAAADLRYHLHAATRKQPAQRIKPATTSVEEFLKYVLMHLVEFPDEVMITHQEAPNKITYSVQMRQSDVGRVIGKQGMTIAAIREVLNAAAARQHKRAALQILEEGER
jgi:predicted RNA-binding protein YlqC (UPF0109 family)